MAVIKYRLEDGIQQDFEVDEQTAFGLMEIEQIVYTASDTNFSRISYKKPTQTLQQEYWEATDKDGNAYSFENYDNAFAFACEREKGYVRTGEWNNAAWDTGIPMDEKDAANAVKPAEEALSTDDVKQAEMEEKCEAPQEDDIFLLKMAEFMEQHNISTAEELFEALGKDNQNGGNGKGGYSM